jgi:UDP-GlcNAc:undecaprenyl-phosphate GlcNAc-1-phosphate transferase
MTQVSVMPRIAIFAALLIVSALIAGKLHLFRPVLLHHTDPKTGDDELVSPQDPEFVEEEEKFEERQAKRLHRHH